MQGFRSLAEGELVEFEAKSCDKGFEATFVCGPDGSDCKGTERRPVGKRKSRKIRFVTLIDIVEWDRDKYSSTCCVHCLLSKVYSSKSNCQMYSNLVITFTVCIP